MKKTKWVLTSFIVFVFVFCISTIFNKTAFLYSVSNKQVNTEVNATVNSNSLASITTFWDDQYLVSKNSHIYKAANNLTNEENVISADPNSTTTEDSLEDTDQMAISEVEQSAALDEPTHGTNLPVTEEKPVEVEVEAEALYENIGISIAKSYVNIREEASTDSSILGKLYRDSAVEVINTQEGWYYVESGSVKGYVKAEFIKTGIPDEELIENYGELAILVSVDGLNVRENTDVDSGKLTVIYLNEVYPVKETAGDWLKIEIADENIIGYINKEYAELIVDFPDAISKEEEEELLRIQAEEKAKKETEIKKQESVNCSQEEIKLLACLIHSEAGTQSYEGKLAVANVVLNRLKSSKYPNTMKDVIYQSGQFSVASSGSLAKQLSNYSNYYSNSQLLSIKAAKTALSGSNNIRSRLYFQSYKSALKKGYDNKSNCVKIGDHLFW